MKKEHKVLIFFLIYNLVICLFIKVTYPFILNIVESEDILKKAIIGIFYLVLIVVALLYDIHYLYNKIGGTSDDNDIER